MNPILWVPFCISVLSRCRSVVRDAREATTNTAEFTPVIGYNVKHLNSSFYSRARPGDLASITKRVRASSENEVYEQQPTSRIYDNYHVVPVRYKVVFTTLCNRVSGTNKTSHGPSVAVLSSK